MKYIDLETFIQMDVLITRKNTGRPDLFAEKLELSRSTFYAYLAYFKEQLGLNVCYNSYRETYYYKDNKNLCSILRAKSCEYCDYKNCNLRNKKPMLSTSQLTD